MIVRAGMNLFPKEIEDVIFDHPVVAQVAVLGLADETWGEIVGAVVMAKPGNSLSADDLYSYCRKNLSPQKAPERWFFTDQYPMTATGKIQKNVLLTWIDEGKIKPVEWERPARRSSIG
jgi:fatty-acyl-CoA synthase